MESITEEPENCALEELWKFVLGMTNKMEWYSGTTQEEIFQGVSHIAHLSTERLDSSMNLNKEGEMSRARRDDGRLAD